VVLGDRTAELATLAGDVAQAGVALGTRPVVHLVEELAALVGGAGRGDRANHAARAHDLLEQAEAGLGELAGDIADDQRVAQVRLVTAVVEHGLGVRDTRERSHRGHALAFSEGLEHLAYHRLHRLPDFLLGNEAHFQVELVELARQAVGARVLIAEARRDLEVAVETGDHQQLLVLLRRLRKRVELAWMDAAGNQEVARALGRRGCQDRCGIFGKTSIFHAIAHIADDLGAGHDVGVQRLAAQIEEAVLEANVLGILLLAGDRHRQFLGAAEHGDPAGEDLDRAGGEVGVHGRGVAGLHLALDGDDAFDAQRLQDRQRRAVAIGHDLGDAVMVAQIDEEHAAMVALAVDPARQADALPGLGGRERAAGVGTVGMGHGVLASSDRRNDKPRALVACGGDFQPPLVRITRGAVNHW
jgi:hypothetical protein